MTSETLKEANELQTLIRATSKSLEGMKVLQSKDLARYHGNTEPIEVIIETLARQLDEYQTRFNEL